MDVLAAAARAIGCGLTAVATLRGSQRSRVIRAAVNGGPDTVIVKAHAPGFAENWSRESAALRVLSGRGLPVPDLLAVLDDPPLIVLTDVGDGPSLADALLADEADPATRRLHAWADAMAAVHTATVDDGPPYATALGPHVSTVDTMPGLLADAADLLAEHLPSLGVTPTGPALEELRGAAAALGPRAHAMTPADACPDNNVATVAGLMLVDFEQATMRHVAWDAAYLLVPWPSCWCSWDLPTGVAGAALTRWRATVATTIPVVGTAAFDRDLDVAVAAWALLSCGWFLPAALDEQAEAPARWLRGPTRRAVIAHRLRLAARRPVMPALADLAEDVLAATTRSWGDLTLPVAPAYR